MTPGNSNADPLRRRRLVVAGCGLAAGVLLLASAFIGLKQVTDERRQQIAFETLTPGSEVRRSPTSTWTGTPSLTATSEPTPTVTEVAIPSATPLSTSAPIPTASPQVTRSATAIPPTSAPTLSPRRIGNGPDLNASFLPTERFSLDGNLNEWSQSGVLLVNAHDTAKNWSGPQDLSGGGSLAWNQQYLYVAVIVVDDVHVQTQTSWEMFRGDSVELWIDADLAGDFNNPKGDGDDWQFGFSPGNFRRIRPEGVVYLPRRDAQFNRQIGVAARQSSNGYTLEAQVPWSIINVQPRRGLVLGYTIDLSDNDAPGTAQQQTQATENPNFRFNVPTTFGNLILQ